jgi:hypothetical protein
VLALKLNRDKVCESGNLGMNRRLDFLLPLKDDLRPTYCHFRLLMHVLLLLLDVDGVLRARHPPGTARAIIQGFNLRGKEWKAQ